jgi:oxygen-independent coproporphyrinogen-3 oxidase
VSVYLLALEPDTALGRQVARGELELPDDLAQAGMLELVAERLAAAGYLHNEVSNFARRPAWRSRHNLAGWRLADYLGLGAGACGSRRCRLSSDHWAERYTNRAVPEEYIDLVGRCEVPLDSAGLAAFAWCELEIIDRATSFREALMLGLRLRDGVALATLEREYGSAPVELLREKARPLMAAGLLELSGGRLMISRRGFCLGDELTVALF